MRLAVPPRSGCRIRPPVVGVIPRGLSSSASGLPRVSATMRSHTCTSMGPLTTELRRSRASASCRPSTTISGSPPKSSLGSRLAMTMATDSANSRRATNASACADSRSNHWASSTTQRRGRVSAASDTRFNTARPTRKRSGGGPELRPNTVSSASLSGARKASEPIKQRNAHLVQGGERELDLRFDPGGAHNPEVGCRVDRVVQQRGLADARLAAEHQSAGLAGAHRFEQVVEGLALAAAPTQRP